MAKKWGTRIMENKEDDLTAAMVSPLHHLLPPYMTARLTPR
jgi:hypothetical protein